MKELVVIQEQRSLVLERIASLALCECFRAMPLALSSSKSNHTESDQEKETLGPPEPVHIASRRAGLDEARESRRNTTTSLKGFERKVARRSPNSAPTNPG